jgi:hypothetical protein
VKAAAPLAKLTEPTEVLLKTVTSALLPGTNDEKVAVPLSPGAAPPSQLLPLSQRYLPAKGDKKSSCVSPSHVCARNSSECHPANNSANAHTKALVDNFMSLPAYLTSSVPKSIVALHSLKKARRKIKKFAVTIFNNKIRKNSPFFKVQSNSNQRFQGLR